VATVLGLALMAPPVYPQRQNTTDQLNSLMTDSINLKATVKQLQDSLDQKNAETTKLLQQVLSSFASIDANFQKLNESVAASNAANKAASEKSTRDLQDTRTALDNLKKSIDESMLGIRASVTSLGREITDMKSSEQSLPSAAQMFNQAWTELDSGLYEPAASDFREFLKNYPNDPVRSASAQFYLGEALMGQKKFLEAITEFDTTLSKFPNDDRKCSALYRKGQSLVQLKQIPQATAVFQSVTKDCAGTQEATNATADLKSLKTPPRGN
jgi:tol-pal system protein YbgF